LQRDHRHSGRVERAEDGDEFSSERKVPRGVVAVGMLQRRTYGRRNTDEIQPAEITQQQREHLLTACLIDEASPRNSRLKQNERLSAAGWWKVALHQRQ